MTSSFKILAAFALCVIFTILVSFSRDNALFASKAKINVFFKFFRTEQPRRGQRSEEKISKNVDFSFWSNGATSDTNNFYGNFPNFGPLRILVMESFITDGLNTNSKGCLFPLRFFDWFLCFFKIPHRLRRRASLLKNHKRQSAIFGSQVRGGGTNIQAPGGRVGLGLSLPL